MTVTLAWLLAQSELRLRLVTDVPTTRTLTWAHGIDVDDPTPWLTGGELVLTTGLRLARSSREQQAYAERLADAGVAGIGFGVGVRFEKIPRPIIDVCAEREPSSATTRTSCPCAGNPCPTSSPQTQHSWPAVP